MKGAEQGEMLTVRQVAKVLGVSEGMVYKLVATRQLAAHHFGTAVRVASGELERYLQKTRTDGAA